MEGPRVAKQYGKPRLATEPVTLLPPHLMKLEYLPAPPLGAPPATEKDNFVLNRTVTREVKTKDDNNYPISQQYLPKVGAGMAARDILTYAIGAWSKDTLPTSGPEFDFVNIVKSQIGGDKRPWYSLQCKRRIERPVPGESVLWQDRKEDDDPNGGLEVLDWYEGSKKRTLQKLSEKQDKGVWALRCMVCDDWHHFDPENPCLHKKGKEN